jgi:cytochrome c oxidase subunit 2
MQQQIVLAVTLLGMLCVAIPFILTARSASSSVSPTPLLEAPSRRVLVLLLIILGAIVTTATLWVWPHRVIANASTQTVNVTGHQWFWEFEPKTVKAGSPVVFNVNAGDVNHGLGVYSPDKRLLFQVQAMPGYLNRVEYTFDKPGTYQILCMEFCGIGHHLMSTNLTVTAPDQNQGTPP